MIKPVVSDLFIARLLQKEPWRNNSGSQICEGELDWDGGPLWLCKCCGRIGKSTFVMHTRPVVQKLKVVFI